MPRKYRHLKDYKKELIEYIEQGHTLRETGEKFGFTYPNTSTSTTTIVFRQKQN